MQYKQEKTTEITYPELCQLILCVNNTIKGVFVAKLDFDIDQIGLDLV